MTEPLSGPERIFCCSCDELIVGPPSAWDEKPGRGPVCERCVVGVRRDPTYRYIEGGESPGDDLDGDARDKDQLNG